jgi:hypothetical protein
VGDADRELGKRSPQCLFVVRPVLPCGLKHFVRVERQAPVQQILGNSQGFGRRQLEVIRNAWNAFAALRKWSTEGVAGTIASGWPDSSRSRSATWSLWHDGDSLTRPADLPSQGITRE